MKIKNLALRLKNNILEERISKYFFVSLFLFTFFIILGALFSNKNPEAAELFFEEISSKYSFVQNYGFWQLFYFIFKNNLLIAFLSYIFGAIFGLPTLFILVTNALVIGLVIEFSSHQLNLLMIVLSTAPHGIFEIPAIILSFSLGIYVGVSVFNYVFRKHSIKENLIFSFKYFYRNVIPLLFVAAFIESVLISVLK